MSSLWSWASEEPFFRSSSSVLGLRTPPDGPSVRGCGTKAMGTARCGLALDCASPTHCLVPAGLWLRLHCGGRVAGRCTGRIARDTLLDVVEKQRVLHKQLPLPMSCAPLPGRAPQGSLGTAYARKLGHLRVTYTALGTNSSRPTQPHPVPAPPGTGTAVGGAHHLPRPLPPAPGSWLSGSASKNNAALASDPG